jgi:thiamine-monophosphate kinase
LTDVGLGEFGRIARFFAPLARSLPGAFGLTDDGAVLDLGPGRRLVVTTDALVAGVHFVGDEPAGDVARKALRVNLSDLAAMGAEPVAYSLVTALPTSVDDGWVAGFADGLAADQAEFGILLSGGDSVATPGPITISITAMGAVGEAWLSRSGARVDDLVCVSGTIGDGALGLDVLRGRLALDSVDAAFLVDRYRRPRPRHRLGPALVGVASACIDISDGLLADLGHLAQASGVGARVWVDRLPLSPAAAAARERMAAFVDTRALAGGDDYELLFTVDPANRDKVLAIARALEVAVTEIGKVVVGAGVRAVAGDGTDVTPLSTGWRHG